MQWAFLPMTEHDVQVLVGWHYPEPYSFYDWTADPDDLAELFDPRSRERWYYAAHDDQGAVVGFLMLRENGGTVELGLGLRPDLTGQGHGTPFLLAALSFAQRRYVVIRFQLAVATFNERAIRVYERAGFRPGRVFVQQTNGGEFTFVAMSRDA